MIQYNIILYYNIAVIDVISYEGSNYFSLLIFALMEKKKRVFL